MSTLRDANHNYLGNINDGYVTNPHGSLERGVRVYDDGEVYKYGKLVGKFDSAGYYWDRYSGRTDIYRE